MIETQMERDALLRTDAMHMSQVFEAQKVAFSAEPYPTPDTRLEWDERPFLIFVKKAGAELTAQSLLSFFEGKIAKWWTPDDVVFVLSIPIGATGKMLKGELRQQYANHLLGEAMATG